jgi:hypothetical protein
VKTTVYFLAKTCYNGFKNNLIGDHDMHYDHIKEAVRVTLKQEVDRYPDFRVPAGKTGTIESIVRGHHDVIEEIWVRMDEVIDGCEEWDNKIQWWYVTDMYSVADEFLDDCELTPIKLRLTYNSALNEWTVWWYENGKKDTEKSYFTDDEDDARTTMAYMADLYCIKDFC